MFKNKVTLDFIKFNLEEYRDTTYERFKEEKNEKLKSHLEKQLEWMNNALECEHNKFVTEKICDEEFYKELEIYLGSRHVYKLFPQGITKEEEEQIKKDMKYFVDKMYKCVEAIELKFEDHEEYDIRKQYKFVEELTIKLYFIYERDFNYKYNLDEEMEDDE